MERYPSCSRGDFNLLGVLVREYLDSCVPTNPILLFIDGGFGKEGKPIVRGGEEVALHIRL